MDQNYPPNTFETTLRSQDKDFVCCIFHRKIVENLRYFEVVIF